MESLDLGGGNGSGYNGSHAAFLDSRSGDSSPSIMLQYHNSYNSGGSNLDDLLSSSLHHTSTHTVNNAINIVGSAGSNGSLGNYYNSPSSLNSGSGSIPALSSSPLLPNSAEFVGSYGEHPLGEHPSRTLFVRNINSNVEDEELTTLFEVKLQIDIYFSFPFSHLYLIFLFLLLFPSSRS